MSESGVGAHPGITRRERTRRRAVWGGLAVLAVLSVSPLFTHHLFSAAGAEIVGRSHIVALCLVALQTLITPVHEFFHYLFVGGVLYALLDRVHAMRLAHRGLKLLTLKTPAIGGPLWEASAAAGVDPRNVREAAGLPGAALTIGWWRPTIYVADETIQRLDHDQLVAVLLHEGAHARRRDPLRMSLLRFLACTLFWLPAVRRLADDVADDAEILADDAASAGRPLVLASALLEVAKFPRHTLPVAAVGFHARPLLERRVRRLLGEDLGPSTHLTRRSAMAAAFALFVLLGSGTVMAHPVAGESQSAHEDHCSEHSVPVTSHLFCLFDQVDHAAGDCPHQSHDHVL